MRYEECPRSSSSRKVKGRTIATIKHYESSINTVHWLYGHSRPGETVVVKSMMESKIFCSQIYFIEYILLPLYISNRVGDFFTVSNVLARKNSKQIVLKVVCGIKSVPKVRVYLRSRQKAIKQCKKT